MLSTLPVELITAIFTPCSKSDLLSLSLASKMFRDISEPLRYRDVCISCRNVEMKAHRDELFRRIVGLYEILRNDGNKAKMVQTLEIVDLRFVLM